MAVLAGNVLRRSGPLRPAPADAPAVNHSYLIVNVSILSRLPVRAGCQLPRRAGSARYSRFPAQVGGLGIFHVHVCRFPLAPSSVIRAAGTVFFAPSSVMCAVGSIVSAFPDWSPLLPVYSCSRALPDLGHGPSRRTRQGTCPILLIRRTSASSPVFRVLPARASLDGRRSPTGCRECSPRTGTGERRGLRCLCLGRVGEWLVDGQPEHREVLHDLGEAGVLDGFDDVPVGAEGVGLLDVPVVRG